MKDPRYNLLHVHQLKKNVKTSPSHVHRPLSRRKNLDASRKPGRGRPQANPMLEGGQRSLGNIPLKQSIRKSPTQRTQVPQQDPSARQPSDSTSLPSRAPRPLSVVPSRDETPMRRSPSLEGKALAGNALASQIQNQTGPTVLEHFFKVSEAIANKHGNTTRSKKSPNMFTGRLKSQTPATRARALSLIHI